MSKSQDLSNMREEAQIQLKYENLTPNEAYSKTIHRSKQYAEDKKAVIRKRIEARQNKLSALHSFTTPNNKSHTRRSSEFIPSMSDSEMKECTFHPRTNSKMEIEGIKK